MRHVICAENQAFAFFCHLEIKLQFFSNYAKSCENMICVCRMHKMLAMKLYMAIGKI